MEGGGVGLAEGAALPAAEAILKDEESLTESDFSQIFVESSYPGLRRRANKEVCNKVTRCCVSHDDGQQTQDAPGYLREPDGKLFLSLPRGAVHPR